MKRMFKRLKLILAAGLLALVACGGNPKTPDAGTTDGGNTNQDGGPPLCTWDQSKWDQCVLK